MFKILLLKIKSLQSIPTISFTIIDVGDIRILVYSREKSKNGLIIFVEV